MSVTAYTILKKREDFLHLRRGRKFVCPYFMLRYAPNAKAGDVARVGYTVTSKCGNAAVRNRIKRRLRALTRELFPAAACTGYDYNFIALEHANMQDVPYATLKKEVARAIAYVKQRT